MNLKTTLITLSCVAGLLILITFYVVFYGSAGTYVVSSDIGSGAGIFATSTGSQAGEADNSTTSLALASSSASSTDASSSLSSTAASGGSSITWAQGNETLSVTNASISGSQLTLGVQVTMGSVSECVPLTMRLVADEQGNLSPPITSQLTFPDTGTCTGTAGETYSAQPIVFDLASPDAFPIVLTTGGTANTLFEVAQNSDGSLSVQLPPSAD